jgi:hypothetical protein
MAKNGQLLPERVDASMARSMAQAESGKAFFDKQAPWT